MQTQLLHAFIIDCSQPPFVGKVVLEQLTVGGMWPVAWQQQQLPCLLAWGLEATSPAWLGHTYNTVDNKRCYWSKENLPSFPKLSLQAPPTPCHSWPQYER